MTATVGVQSIEAHERAAVGHDNAAAESAARGDDARAETERRAARIERELAENARTRFAVSGSSQP